MIRRGLVSSILTLFVGGVSATGLWADEAKPPKPKPKPAQAETKLEKPKEVAPKEKEDEYELHKLLVDTIDQVQRNYVKQVSRRELIEAAIKGVLRELDPYSSYISPQELTTFRTSVESEFGGIGIQVTAEGGQLRVISPLVGTPAYRAGVIAGDRITEIDGKPTAGITIDQAVRRLKGLPGTQVTLTIIHSGKSTPEKVTVVRENIHVETVLGDRRNPDDSWDFILDHERSIGYVRVTAFSRDTARELRAVLTRLRQERLRGLVLDLRFNPGGLLNSAIEVCNLFVSEGRIVSVQGRNAPERVWNARKNGSFVGFPMVVLVNRFSASASEIVAACLQDHKRAVIVGERTWGKGSVQNVIEMEEGQSALKLTTASYRRPNGKNIHRFPNSKEADEWGVTPEKGYALRLSEEELFRLVTDRRLRDIVRPKEPAQPEPKLLATAQPAPLTTQPAAKPVVSVETKPQPGAGKTEPVKKPEPAKKSEKVEPGKKPEGAKPSEKPADKPAEKPADKASSPTRPEKPGAPAAPLEHARSVDPHLRMALDYLAGEIARAK